MTEADVQRIETMLGRVFPLDYRRILIDYSFAPGSWAAECAMPELDVTDFLPSTANLNNEYLVDYGILGSYAHVALASLA